MTWAVINYMPVLLLGIIIVAISVGFMAWQTAPHDMLNDDTNTDQHQDQAQSDITESVSQNEPVVPPKNTGHIIDLSSNGLTKAPEYIFSRTAVTQLDLSNNSLEGSLPAEVRQLQNLRVLNLSNNNFTGVPAEIGQLRKLEVLNLSNNQLTGLPYELGNLSNLQVLDLRGNQYSTQDLARIKENLPSTIVIKVD